MKIAELNFPSPLLSALRDGELVIFAGAGVSKGKPACLPLFKELAEKIAQGTGEVLKDGEPEDRFLGRLHNKGKGVKVHERAVQELSRNNSKSNDLPPKSFAALSALLHESCLGYLCRMLFPVQLISSTRYDWGLPRWIIRLRIAQPRRLSTC